MKYIGWICLGVAMVTICWLCRDDLLWPIRSRRPPDGDGTTPGDDSR